MQRLHFNILGLILTNLECGDDGGDGVELLRVPLHAAPQVHHELVRHVLHLARRHHNLRGKNGEKVCRKHFSDNPRVFKALIESQEE